MSHLVRLSRILGGVSCASICALALVPMELGFAQTESDASSTPVLPEEDAIPLVTDLSTELATRISGASCQEFNDLLDRAQAEANDPNRDETSLINQVLGDVRTSPKLRSITVEKLGEPLLNKILDCNLVPVNALTQ